MSYYASRQRLLEMVVIHRSGIADSKTSAGGSFGWAHQNRRRLLQKGNRLPRARCTSHPRQGLASCRLPPFTPLSSLCGSTSWLMLHSHYPESCCWLLHLHPLSFTLSHVCPLSVIAFSFSDSHSLFSSHALQRSFCFKKRERGKTSPFGNCGTRWWVRQTLVYEIHWGAFQRLQMDERPRGSYWNDLHIFM